jgi:hypothetical protein
VHLILFFSSAFFFLFCFPSYIYTFHCILGVVLLFFSSLSSFSLASERSIICFYHLISDHTRTTLKKNQPRYHDLLLYGFRGPGAHISSNGHGLTVDGLISQLIRSFAMGWKQTKKKKENIHQSARKLYTKEKRNRKKGTRKRQKTKYEKKKETNQHTTTGHLFLNWFGKGGRGT